MSRERLQFGSRGQYCGEGQTREQARCYFLEVVREVCPEVMIDLRERVFPRYQAWAKRVESKYPSVLAGTRHPVFRDYILLQQHALQVADGIAEWGQRFYLVGELPKAPEWCGQQWHDYAREESLWPWQKALEALYAWCWLEDGPQLRNSDPPRWPSLRTLETPNTDQFKLHLEVPGFDPGQQQTGADYIKQVLAKAKLTLREYVEFQKQRALTAGQRRTVKKSASVHFAWLALRQVRGWSDRQIADWHRSRTELIVTPDAVRHGSSLAADLIQLKLRKFKPGRPTT